MQRTIILLFGGLTYLLSLATFLCRGRQDDLYLPGARRDRHSRRCRGQWNFGHPNYRDPDHHRPADCQQLISWCEEVHYGRT